MKEAFGRVDVEGRRSPHKRGETPVGRADLRERRESQCSRGGSETTITHDVYRSTTGFCREVFRELPMEFAVEAQKLLSVSLEGSVG